MPACLYKVKCIRKDQTDLDEDLLVGVGRICLSSHLVKRSPGGPQTPGFSRGPEEQGNSREPSARSLLQRQEWTQ